MRKCCTAVLALVLAGWVNSSAEVSQELRQVVDLDGTWQIGQGSLTDKPTQFDSSVPVPGLVDLAQPPFSEVGQKSGLRQAFWYRRTFQIAGPVPAVATLKILKATYGVKVFLNGTSVGEHFASFTAGYFDVASQLKGNHQDNELVIRVGADPDEVPPSFPRGHDQERIKYIPGIFDDVQLILSGTPNIVRMQAAPDLPHDQVRVQVLLHNAGGAIDSPVEFTVREAKSGQVVGTLVQNRVHLAAQQDQTIDVKIPIAHVHLWSPEDPFLYSLEVATSADQVRQRFGMREFHFNPADGKAYLNGRLYYMRGSNITLYRFFEDAERGALPWNKDWVRRLHQSFKGLNWNCLRLCIGFPPDFWYDIADEEGILLQDEFPVWGLDVGCDLHVTSEELAREYAEHMQDHWNHPSIVLWDAQNETNTALTGQALQQVRALDLSQRPWDNGWGGVVAPGDSCEVHPYHYLFNQNVMSGLATSPGDPSFAYVHPQGYPVSTGKLSLINNEYGGIWLQRDGQPTKITRPFYEHILGPNPTAEQCRQTYAHYMAADTEFWRGHRACAAVMQFCALSYSRPDAVTSDDFVDVRNLVYEPHLYAALKNAFSPVGLMIDYWETGVRSGEKKSLQVTVLNDLYKPWQGTITLRLARGGKTLSNQPRSLEVDALGCKHVPFELQVPAVPGDYDLQAVLEVPGGAPVVSDRLLRVSK